MSKRKSFNFLILLLIAVVGIYLWLDNRRVKVIAVHHDQYSAEVLVDHLPAAASSAINWWLKNQNPKIPGPLLSDWPGLRVNRLQLYAA